MANVGMPGWVSVTSISWGAMSSTIRVAMSGASA